MEDILDDHDGLAAASAASYRLSTGQFQKQMTRIRNAAEAAQKKIDYRTAHNEHVRRAIEVVEEFLARSHRLCYGGQAINAQLPRRYQFYDPEYSIPDYDFFTPSQDADIRDITRALRHAGFTEISAREGMHEGTIKIYVDYVPVADVTAMDPALYRTLSKREFRKDEISYVDANTLRMMMYLELSRPNGEVSRWPKIYERLLLFNEFVPLSTTTDHGHGKPTAKIMQPSLLSTDETYLILRFIVTHERVFAGGDLLSFFKHTASSRRTQSIDWILRSKKPILFYSSEPAEDAEELRALLLDMPKSAHERKRAIAIRAHETKGHDMIPSMHVLLRAKKPLVYIIHSTACHSYQDVPIHFENKGTNTLRIASMDTLITLYFSLGLMKGKGGHSMMGSIGSMDALANQLVDLSMAHRSSSSSSSGSRARDRIPFISLTCSGHQTALSSLIRAKVARVLRKRQMPTSTTQKQSSARSASRSTRRSKRF